MIGLAVLLASTMVGETLTQSDKPLFTPHGANVSLIDYLRLIKNPSDRQLEQKRSKKPALVYQFLKYKTLLFEKHEEFQMVS